LTSSARLLFSDTGKIQHYCTTTLQHTPVVIDISRLLYPPVKPSNQFQIAMSTQQIIKFVIFICFFTSFCFNVYVFKPLNNEAYLAATQDSYNIYAYLSDDDAQHSPNRETIQNSTKRETIHWNDTIKYRNPPKIYICNGDSGNGMGESKLLLTAALPEYTINDLSQMKIGEGRPPKSFPPEYLEMNYTNPHDVFVSTFSMEHCTPKIYKWLLTHFNGQIAIFSGESEKDHPIRGVNRDHVHAFGPLMHARNQDMVVTYLQMTYWKIFQEILTPSVMVDPKLRPRGTQNHYMMYANSNCVGFREEAVGRLSEFGPIHCGGKCKGKTPPSGNRTNLVKIKTDVGIRNWWENVKYYADYRFCFVMEHEESHPTYMTEKIIMAFSAGCIPIYYGPAEILNIFNEKAFVFYNISDPEPALKQVKALEENKEMYEMMLQEPIVAQGNLTIEKYFSFSDDVGGGAMKRIMREKLGLGDHFMP
jgi:hypothetical protein